MNYTILVNTTNQTAYQFCKTLLKNNHRIVRVFFYQDGVYNADGQNKTDLSQSWQALAKDYPIELALCVTSASRRGITEANLADKFKITGLGQLIEAIINSDRFISFG